MNSRKEWIDGLRALAMLIVMTWHISNGINSQWLFSLITAPIMIPLFFSITGYVFNDCEGNQKLFYTKLFKYLVFPWLCLAFLKGSINALINRSFEYFRIFIKSFYRLKFMVFPLLHYSRDFIFLQSEVIKEKFKTYFYIFYYSFNDRLYS